MNAELKAENMRTPWWVWAIIAVLSLIQPVLHVWIRFFPPEGTISTGLHIQDSALFLYSMRMFENGFASLYATCQSLHGDHSAVFYSVPHLWLYGALGFAARLLHADPFLAYGAANGLGAFLYLWVVYRLLRLIAPRQAAPAFVLFALSAGPGGLLYLLTGALGWHQHPLFETCFSRFAYYDLMEGPHLNPVLYFPRFYYTLSLALCLGGFTAVVRAARDGSARIILWWALPVALGSFIDARFSVFTLGVLFLFLWLGTEAAFSTRLRLAAAYAIPALVGLVFAHLLMRMNPVVIENHLQVGNMAMWFSPFVVVAWLHLLLSAGPVYRAGRALPAPARFLTGAGLGYFLAYAAGYVLYQGYYGNLLTGRDGSVAAAISDPACVGALLGVPLAWRRKAEKGTQEAEHWIALWFAGFLALSISGWGGGWFLKFGPQRLQVFLWLPLCVLAAKGLPQNHKKMRLTAWAILLCCGMASILVASFAFQGPWGRTGARGPYRNLHPEIISETDAALMARLGPGTVLAPAPASDVIASRRGNPVVFGIGSFNLTDQPYVPLRAEVETFFAPDTPDDTRREIARRWCAAYVYCPDTWPVDVRTREALQHSAWLREIGRGGDAALYAVNQ